MNVRLYKKNREKGDVLWKMNVRLYKKKQGKGGRVMKDECTLI